MADDLRMLVVGANWPPETFLLRLFNGLAERGIHITLATSARPDADWLAHPQHHWIYAPNWVGSTPKLALQILRLATREVARGGWRGVIWAIWQYRSHHQLSMLNRMLPFARLRWDVIYFPWTAAAVEYYLPLLDVGVPTLISCRGSQVNVGPFNPARQSLRDGLQVAFDRVSAVHCVSQDILNEAINFGLNPDKAIVIPPAVDPQLFSPASVNKRADHFSIVTVGNLAWVKGFEYALLAIKQLRDAGIPAEFEIIGDGPERDRILFTIHDLGLQDHVRLAGKLPSTEVVHRLQQADAFLLSSLSEGISNAVLEAMACGLPVVSTDCGGMREAIRDGVDGLIVPLRDPAAMAAALQRIYYHPHYACELADAARERILRDFSLDSQITSFAGLLKKVAQQP